METQPNDQSDKHNRHQKQHHVFEQPYSALCWAFFPFDRDTELMVWRRGVEINRAQRPTISVCSFSDLGSTRPSLRPRCLPSRAARKSCRALRKISLLLVSVSSAALSISRLRSSERTTLKRTLMLSSY